MLAAEAGAFVHGLMLTLFIPKHNQDYGETYFLSRKSTYGIVPTEEDCEKGDKILKKFRALRRVMTEAAAATAKKNQVCVDKSCVAEQSLAVQTAVLEVVRNMSETWQNAVLMTLPEDPTLGRLSCETRHQSHVL